jgi:hypothetical protein
MAGLFRNVLDRLAKPAPSPHGAFGNDHYQRHNQRRLEHLATLGLDLAGSTVLEVGAGVGDHTSFFLDRGCRVVSTEVRDESLALLRARYPQIEVRKLDMEHPEPVPGGPFDVVYCYGLLYHLRNPAGAVAYMADCCRRLLLLETCVSFGDAEEQNPCPEPAEDYTQSAVGVGCRPTRPWVFHRLKEHFPFVYVTRTQPWHEEFPLDWSAPPPGPGALTRAVFVASRSALPNPALMDGIPTLQTRG